jgi:hypothetical protein
LHAAERERWHAETGSDCTWTTRLAHIKPSLALGRERLHANAAPGRHRHRHRPGNLPCNATDTIRRRHNIGQLFAARQREPRLTINRTLSGKRIMTVRGQVSLTSPGRPMQCEGHLFVVDDRACWDGLGSRAKPTGCPGAERCGFNPPPFFPTPPSACVWA